MAASSLRNTDTATLVTLAGKLGLDSTGARLDVLTRLQKFAATFPALTYLFTAAIAQGTETTGTTESTQTGAGMRYRYYPRDGDTVTAGSVLIPAEGVYSATIVQAYEELVGSLLVRKCLSGQVFSIVVTNPGTYTVPPTFSPSGGGGSALAGTVVMYGTGVLRVDLTNLGTGYTSLPTVAFAGGTGGGATCAIGSAAITGQVDGVGDVKVY